MAYQVLARKWRPQDFSAVVGQEPIVTALRNALTEGRIAQAYLFSGIRGVGKTSVARILAKALNCDKGLAKGPCNDCGSCREITSGADLDVIEVDAATHSKVEQIRELTESLKYAPAGGRRKVVVIDEIHRLSRQAFDALLKIVEEPPDHLVFVFATTEIETVPATILSRCQEYRFRRVPAAKLAEHLKEIAAAEDIAAGDKALRLIARAGDGSVRDAVALLDQLATHGSGKIADGEAARILGGVENAVFQELLNAILNGDARGVSETVTEIEQQGWDPRRAYTDFLGYCRDGLHLALGATAEQVDLPDEESAALAALARGAGHPNLLRLLNALLASEQMLRRSEVGALALEIAWLRAAELPKLQAIEELLAGASSPPVPAAEPAAKATSSASASAASRPDSSRGAKPTQPRQPALAEPVPEPPAARARTAEVQRFLDEVSRHKQPLAAHLAEAEQLELADSCLRIVTPARDRWLFDALDRGNNRLVLESALASVWGEGATWKIIERRGKKPADIQEAAAESALDDAVRSHPRVQTMLEIFGGSIETVKDLGPPGER